ncbi:MAG: DUF3784 domain-containing protein [Bacteroidota bacterium]|nr:DUF3784 domain-containing protein [Bacteroidota bacterium]
MPEFIAFTIVGLVIILMSYLIKYKKMAYLISGYDDNEVADKDGLCNWMGGMLMWPGVYAIIAGAIMWKYPAAVLPLGLSFGVVTIVITIIAIIGARKFKKNRD